MSAVVGAVLAAVWRVIGVSDDVTECGLCGRTDLARTIALLATDGTGDVVHVGSDCAARALGWTVRDVERSARAAVRARAAEDARVRHAAMAEESARFLEWVRARYGVSVSEPGDLWGKVPERTPFALRAEWRRTVEPDMSDLV
jgi:hypothetical protein